MNAAVLFNLTRAVTATEAGSLQRCAHGVYDPHGDGRYCSVCTPIVPAPRVDGLWRNWDSKLSKSGLSLRQVNTTGIGDTDARPDGDRCPQCLSKNFYVLRGGKRQCADCNEIYKPSRAAPETRA